jgi:hypothetical protein
MIQNVRTRWNNIFEMLKRAHFLRDTIEEWFIHTVVLKLQCLKLTANEWKQIETIIDILRSFQQITNSLNSSTQSIIHIAWIVYNIMHVHLKNCSQKLKKNAVNFFWICDRLFMRHKKSWRSIMMQHRAKKTCISISIYVSIHVTS